VTALIGRENPNKQKFPVSVLSQKSLTITSHVLRKGLTLSSLSFSDVTMITILTPTLNSRTVQSETQELPGPTSSEMLRKVLDILVTHQNQNY
jgi:hypothetical protein